MSTYEMEILAWYGLVPQAFILPIAYMYSNALMRGLASARDEHHRMTPMGPWEFFDMKFKPRSRKATMVAIPLLLIGNVVSLFDLLNAAYLDKELVAVFPTFWLAIVGQWMVARAVAVLIAPRVSNPAQLCGIAMLIGAGAWNLYFWFMLMARRNDENDVILWLLAFSLIGVIAHAIAWRIVRNKPGATWFRLEN